jgi:hypothetical protein
MRSERINQLGSNKYEILWVGVGVRVCARARVCILALVTAMQTEYFLCCIILSHMACLAVPNFSTLSKKMRDTRRKVFDIKFAL